ncbi:fumarylacetoacetase [Cryptosporangium sp. NPDC048952]|uniref:fumarylacetoacetase n=1 Tax=Cryptosporangium sp. NPDC048952 TaxID=3363961 RepID=UPI003719326C
MTWLDLPRDTGYGVTNLPYGVFSVAGDAPRTGVAIGDRVLDVAGVTSDPVHATGSLNAFMAQGVEAWAALRAQLTQWLSDGAHRDRVEPHLVPRDQVTLHLPFEVADYVDFYSSQHHASNLGQLFRPGSPPLTPNWKHLPIGYHGRSGTVQVSGAPVVRPSGQRKAPSEDVPTFGPSRRLDIEAEIGFVVGVPAAGPVPVTDFASHVFGVCVVNDWSARDLQAWEYVPLGPFLGKSFATSVSPWVVPLAALGAARVDPPARDVELLPYLDDTKERWGLDLRLTVSLNGVEVSKPPFRQLYWTAAQQLAHLTVNGASLRTGDLFASGTVSGEGHDERGSLIELAWNGECPISLPDGSTRTFLEDGDTVTISATAPAVDGSRLTLGEVTGRIEPAP